MITAHVIGSPHLTQIVVNWMIGLTIPIALVVAALLRRQEVRQVPLLVATAAGVTFIIGLRFPLFPPAPPLRLWLADPRAGTEVTRPVEFQVCATGSDGAPAQALSGGDLLAVFLDGSQVSTMSSSEFLLALGAGRHEVRVELVDPQHRAFNPDISTEVVVTAGSVSAVTLPHDCPH